MKIKTTPGQPNQKFHYSEDKASYKVVALTYPDAAIIPITLTWNPSWMLSNQASYLKGSSMKSFTLGLLPKIDLNFSITATHNGNGLRVSGSAQ